MKDVSEGSRLEITGIRTLSDALDAIDGLFDLGAQGAKPFHCYLDESGFAFWVEAPQGNPGKSDNVTKAKNGPCRTCGKAKSHTVMGPECSCTY